MDRPTIVCLCGSMRPEFAHVWRQKYRDESLALRIVLAAAVMPGDEPIRNDDSRKPSLDELHKRKIDLADEVLILNVDDYVGPSTQSEIDYAQAHGKTLRWLEPHKGTG